MVISSLANIVLLFFNCWFQCYIFEQISGIIKRRPPLFFNLREQDSGIVTAGRTDTHSSASVSEEDNSTSVTEEDSRTDLYQPVKSNSAIGNLLERALDEYNKIHPHIRLSLYQVSIVVKMYDYSHCLYFKCFVIIISDSVSSLDILTSSSLMILTF